MASRVKSPRVPVEAERFMALALAEARKGLGTTRPNPAVGAVLVKDGRVIARGYHARAGGPHAEVVALRKAGEHARGADLYVTLEPCDHHGRTPPCTGAILAAGVARVFVGSVDVNPIVSGRGIRRLKRGGVQVVRGVLEADCLALNRPFFTFITERRPYVTLKAAATLDGRIATRTGDSRWVSGPESRERVHALREQVDAILAGAGTVRLDDPQLTARPKGRLSRRQPLRVVLSGSLDVSPKARVFDEPSGGVLVLTSADQEKRARALRARGAEVVVLPSERGRLDVRAVLDELYRRDVMHLLVEGGAQVYRSFLEGGLVDRLMLFLAPKILGEGIDWAPLPAKAKMDHAIPLEDLSVERVGEDVLVTGRPR